MKKIGLLMAACLLLTQTAFAMLPLTDSTIKAAQIYGEQRRGASLGELLAPWTIYDRKQLNKYGLRERVVVYTPYLTAAVDTQQSSGQKPSLAQGMKVAKQYQGVLALGLHLSTSVRLEPKNLKVKIYQGQKVLYPYYNNLNAAVQRDMQLPNPRTGQLEGVNVWDLQYFVYFDLSKLDPNRVMVLSAQDEYGDTREFVLNLTKMN